MNSKKNTGNLRTLNDLFKYDPEEQTAAWHSASQHYKNELKAEAIKWVEAKDNVYIHKERVVLQGRASIMRWWCGLKKWSFTAKIDVVETEIITEDYLREMIKFAGIRFGLLDHRPDFGRYVVKEFKKI